MINENQDLIFTINQGAQGDIVITRQDRLKEDIDNLTNYEKVEPIDNKYIVAHSETGHHHSIACDNVIFVKRKDNNQIFALKVLKQAHLIHEKNAKDKHKTHVLEPGCYEIRRQQEYDFAKGWRLAHD